MVAFTSYYFIYVAVARGVLLIIRLLSHLFQLIVALLLWARYGWDSLTVNWPLLGFKLYISMTLVSC